MNNISGTLRIISKSSRLTRLYFNDDQVYSHFSFPFCVSGPKQRDRNKAVIPSKIEGYKLGSSEYAGDGGNTCFTTERVIRTRELFPYFAKFDDQLFSVFVVTLDWNVLLLGEKYFRFLSLLSLFPPEAAQVNPSFFSFETTLFLLFSNMAPAIIREVLKYPKLAVEALPLPDVEHIFNLTKTEDMNWTQLQAPFEITDHCSRSKLEDA